MIVQITVEHLDIVPHRAVFDIIQALAFSKGERLLDDLVAQIMTGDAQIWLVYENEDEHIGTVVTRIVEFDSGMKSCVIEYLGGLPDKVLLSLDDIQYIENWAKFNNCEDVRVIGRPAWEKKLGKFGYDKYYSIIGKKL